MRSAGCRAALLGVDCFHRRNDADDFRRNFAKLTGIVDCDLTRATHVVANSSTLKVCWGSDLDMAYLLASAFQDPLRVGEGSAVVNPEVHTLRVDRNMENAIAQLSRRTISHRHCTVSVVNILVTRSHLFQNQIACVEIGLGPDPHVVTDDACAVDATLDVDLGAYEYTLSDLESFRVLETCAASDLESRAAASGNDAT